MKRNIRKLLIVSTLIVGYVAVSHANADEQIIIMPISTPSISKSGRRLSTSRMLFMRIMRMDLMTS